MKEKHKIKWSCFALPYYGHCSHWWKSDDVSTFYWFHYHWRLITSNFKCHCVLGKVFKEIHPITWEAELSDVVCPLFFNLQIIARLSRIGKDRTDKTETLQEFFLRCHTELTYTNMASVRSCIFDTLNDHSLLLTSHCTSTQTFQQLLPFESAPLVINYIWCVIPWTII